MGIKDSSTLRDPNTAENHTGITFHLPENLEGEEEMITFI